MGFIANLPIVNLLYSGEVLIRSALFFTSVSWACLSPACRALAGRCLWQAGNLCFTIRKILHSAALLSEWQYFVIPTEKLFRFDEESHCHLDGRSNLCFAIKEILHSATLLSEWQCIVIPTEKLFRFDEESHCHLDGRSNLCFAIKEILHSSIDSFRMTVRCHSDDKRNLFIILD